MANLSPRAPGAGRLLSVLLVAAWLPLACGGPAGPGAASADHSFPTPSELGELGPAPKAAEILGQEVEDIDAWVLEGPLPDRIEVVPRTPASPIESVLLEAVARRAGLATAPESMHCTAREVGRFIAQRGGFPPYELIEFITARCGADVASSLATFLRGPVPADATDATVLEHWRPQIEALVARALENAPREVGLWSSVEDGQAVVAVASARREAHFEPIGTLAEGRRIEIRGEALTAAAEEVSAWINLGLHGFSECRRDAGVRLPRFALTCELAAADRMAQLEVSVRERGRILSRGILRALARVPGEEGREWRRARYAPSRPVSSAEEMPEAVASALAEVRRAAHLPPVALSATQSEDAAELTPHVFAGTAGLEPQSTADLAALGLAAGWRVGGTVKDAWIGSALHHGSLDAGRWLDSALARPGARAALLHPDASVLAVGAVVLPSPPSIAAIATTYVLFGGEDFAAEAAELWKRIESERSARRLARPARLDAARHRLEAAARDLPVSKRTPEAALDEVLRAVAEDIGRPVRGWHLLAPRPEDFPLPSELSQWPSLRLAVAVSYTQPEGWPWGQYVALLVVLPPDLEI
jgi:hypothetical protein